MLMAEANKIIQVVSTYVMTATFKTTNVFVRHTRWLLSKILSFVVVITVQN
jgi:hypothetical protein